MQNQKNKKKSHEEKLPTKQKLSRVRTEKIDVVASTASSFGNLIVKLLEPTDDPAETRRKFISLGGGLILIALFCYEQAHALYLSFIQNHRASIPSYFSGKDDNYNVTLGRGNWQANPKLSLFQKYFCLGAESSPECGKAALSPLVEYKKKETGLDTEDAVRSLAVPIINLKTKQTLTCTRSWFHSDCKF